MTRDRRDARPRAVTRNPGAALIALAIVLAASWFAPVIGLVDAAVARAAATDLTLVVDTVYTVRPQDKLVHVDLVVKAMNTTKETKDKRFYFDHGFLAVLPTASNVKVTGSKGAKAKISKRTKDAAILRLDFGSRLYSGKARTFKVSFDLVDKGAPPERQLRVGAGLVTLPIWAHASTGAKGGTVTVRVPAGWQVDVERGEFGTTKTAADGGTELATDTLAKPLEFFAYIAAQRPPEYTETPLLVTAGDETIALTLRGWADDVAWSERVGGLFTKSLPALREEIGLPWPHAEPLTVEEALNRSANGYAGLFDPAANRVEVAYWADHAVVIHEAAHGWFNGALLADRWANEGFASLYADRAASAIGEPVAPAATVDPAAEDALPLNAWSPADMTSPPADEATRAKEQAEDAYGFAASRALAAAIAERAGDDALRSVWSDAANRIGAWQPDAVTTGGAAAETVDGPPDWRGLLDLLEQRTGKDFTDLWREWVVRPDEAQLLDARAVAAASYQRTLALADGWALPRSIRDALRSWQFDTAEQLMADARTVLAQRGAVESLAAQQGMTLPGDMRGLFEAGQLADASGRAEAERNAILALQGAAAAKTGDTDPLTAIGMLGEDPEADLASGKASLAAGDIDATLASADGAWRAWNGAWQEGRRRALLAVAVLATLLVLGSAVVGRARKARAESRVAVAGEPGVVVMPAAAPVVAAPAAEPVVPAPIVEAPVVSEAEAVMEPVAEAEAVMEPDVVEPEPVAVAPVEPVVEPEPEPVAVAPVEPVVEPEPEPVAVAAVEPVVEPEPEPAPEPAPAPAPRPSYVFEMFRRDPAPRPRDDA